MVQDCWENRVVEPKPALLIDGHPEVYLKSGVSLNIFFSSLFGHLFWQDLFSYFYAIIGECLETVRVQITSVS